MDEKNLLAIVLHFNDGRDIERWQERLMMPELPRSGDYIVWQDDEGNGGIKDKKYLIEKVEYKTLMFGIKREEKAHLGRVDAYLKRVNE